MTRRKTDGERIALNAWKRQRGDQDNAWSVELAESVDRIIRRRMAEAWDEGWELGTKYGDLAINRYRGRKRK